MFIAVREVDSHANSHITGAKLLPNVQQERILKKLAMRLSAFITVSDRPKNRAPKRCESCWTMVLRWFLPLWAISESGK